jgi:hypothetical protein
MLVMASTGAWACAPAPTCWLEEGPSYYKDICRNAARSSDVLKWVEEPDKIGDFIKACAKQGIRVKASRCKVK